MAYATSQIFIPTKRDLLSELKEALESTQVPEHVFKEELQTYLTSLGITMIENSPNLKTLLKRDENVKIYQTDLRVSVQNGWTKLLLPRHLVTLEDELILHGYTDYLEKRSIEEFKKIDFKLRPDVIFAQNFSQKVSEPVILFNLQDVGGFEQLEAWLFQEGEILDFKAAVTGDYPEQTDNLSDFTAWAKAFPKIKSGVWEGLKKTNPLSDILLQRIWDGKILEAFGISRADFYWHKKEKFGPSKLVYSIDLKKKPLTVGATPIQRPVRSEDTKLTEFSLPTIAFSRKTIVNGLINLLYWALTLFILIWIVTFAAVTLDFWSKGQTGEVVSGLIIIPILLLIIVGSRKLRRKLLPS